MYCVVLLCFVKDERSNKQQQQGRRQGDEDGCGRRKMGCLEEVKQCWSRDVQEAAGAVALLHCCMIQGKRGWWLAPALRPRGSCLTCMQEDC